MASGDGNLIKYAGEMIPANQINFSQMERENETFALIMYWARIFINFALFSLIIHEAYILFLATLGVGTQIYGMKQEEKATLQKQQEAQRRTTQRQLFNANQERLREYERLARKRGWKK